MEILNATQIREWDAYTIAKEGIKSIDLMERACVAFVNWFVATHGEYKIDKPELDYYRRINVVCGTGNNGGDGLGIARLLFDRSFNVRVWIIKSENQSADFKKNRARLPIEIPVVEIEQISSFTPDGGLHIDAIFGSGLSRPVEGIYAEVIAKMNQVSGRIIAVDVPSGLRIDEPSSGIIIKAKHTVTFGTIKLPFMFPQYGVNVGEWHQVDIGLDPEYFQDKLLFPDYTYVTDIRDNLWKSFKFAHKGLHGHSLLVAGSFGKMGACVIGARAALRSGLGLLTVHIPRSGYNIIQTSVPEAMASVDKDEEYFSDVPDAAKYDVIGIGPGIGITKSTIAGLRKLMELGKPMVVDADALNIISQNRALLHMIPPNSILTPHPGEFKRLVGEWSNDFQRLELQKQLSAEAKCVVVLKGAHTSITAPGGHVWFNSTGNPGMAKGGSGDALTGVLTALLSQRYVASEAATIGVYIHGRAGDLAAAKIGQNAIIASDIVEFLGQSFGS